MMVIAALEDAFVAQLRETLGARVREVDHRPDRLTDAELARIFSAAPAAYVAVLGLRKRERPEGTWTASLGLYLVAANASGERARRRGDVATVGAYELVEVAIRALDGWAPPEAAGDVEIASVEQLQSEAFEKLGRTVYGLVAEVPVELPRGVDPADLADFAAFDAAWDVPPHGNVAPPSPPPPDAGPGRRDAGDRITLPQS